ncbi:MAG TPA: hypothetical protein VNA13_02435 [Xanthomonadales bacterium]|nr:hypothetical protein [Xanthomonadales bacterium]
MKGREGEPFLARKLFQAKKILTKHRTNTTPWIDGGNPRRDLSLEDDISGKNEALLRPGRIEQLVREGREPVTFGQIGSGYYDTTWKAFYQVPPPGFNPADVENFFMDPGGAYRFKFKDGSTKTCTSYALTENEAKDVEARKISEAQRLESAR